MYRETQKKLEYDKVMDMLQDLCRSPLGKELVRETNPTADLDIVREWQQETTEAKEVLRLGNVPIDGLKDIRSSLQRAAIGGVLDAKELLYIAETLSTGRRLKTFLMQYPDLTLLRSLADQVGVFPKVEQSITTAIGLEGEVLDQASPQLFQLRRQIRHLQGRIKDKLEQILRSPEYQKYFQESIVTIRGDRYVIPVKQEYRSQFSGIVHDQSASGATVFIEPMAIVEINNELRRLTAAEQQEVIRILTELSKLVAVYHSEIKDTLKILARLDFIFAKGRLSQVMDAGEPEINDLGIIDIIGGRHPLIKGRAVPISIHLGKNFDTLIITGPNTGGKTVCLKTAGLFTLMAMSGLHTPAERGTRLSVFDNVFADIGDEQSIEQSLSTFSGHITNIIKILKSLTGRSLVLFDEIGAGTDPGEGAALAKAILTFIQAKGAKTIATTHYSELKTYAFNTPRVENASVEFDPETLRPTYRLVIGLPGRSNALAISQRLGMFTEIIAEARSYLQQDEVELGDLIQDLEEKNRAAAAERDEAYRLRQKYEKELAELKEKIHHMKEKEQRIIDKAKYDALEIVRKARREAEEILRELREKAVQADKSAVRDAEELRAKLKDAAAGLEAALTPPEEDYSHTNQQIRAGDMVEIPKLGQKGYVLTEPNDHGEVQIQAGILKINVKLNELRKIKAQTQKEIKTNYGHLMADKSKTISNELDFRGKTVEEALLEVEKYLDDAYLSGLPLVYLIHGKGTGALRAAVKNYLSGHPYVQSYRPGDHTEGGLGVTVVSLKK